MGTVQRGIVPMLIDLDRRARPDRDSRNRPIQKLVSVADTFALSSETVIVTVSSGAYQWTLQSYRAAVMADSPIRYWRFRELPPSQSINDETATERLTRVSGALTGYESPGNSEPTASALLNNTTTSYLYAGAPLSIVGNMTMETWVRAASTWSIANKIIISCDTLATYLALNATQIFASFYLGGVQRTLAGAAISTAGWHQLVTTWDGTNIRLYVDGALNATSTATAGALGTTNVTVIGAFTTDATLRYDGYLAEPSIFASALSSDRVLAHYNAMVNPSSSGLTNKWVWGASQWG